MMKKAFLIFASLILFTGGTFVLFVETATPKERTHAAMHMMKRRVLRYAHTNGRLPTSVDELPVIKGFDESVTDGWGRPIRISVEGDTVTFSSYGRDGRPGGEGEDADITGVFSAKKADGKWTDEVGDWLVHPYGQRPSRPD